MAIGDWVEDRVQRVKHATMGIVAIFFPITAMAEPTAILPGNPATPPAITEPMQKVSGTVTQYLMNPHGEVDGLLLSEGTQLHFPPHKSANLTQAIKPSDPIEAVGVRENNTPHLRAVIINNTRNGQMVRDTPPLPEERALPPKFRVDELKPLQVEGKVKTSLYTPRGDISGVVLENGSIVRFPPDVATQYFDEIRSSASFTVKGMGAENEYGTSLQALEMGISGQPLSPIYPKSAAILAQRNPGEHLSR